MKKVMTFGTFDMLHPGHLYYLSEAKKLGDYLITVVARDTTVEYIKKRKTREDELTRLRKVRECEYVDTALLGSLTDHYTSIGELKPDILCFGYDQKSFNNEELSDFLKKNRLNPEMIILPPFEPYKWKSSKL